MTDDRIQKPYALSRAPALRGMTQLSF